MPFKPTLFDPKSVTSASPLLQKQQLFAFLLGRWLTFVSTLIGVRVAMGEGYVAVTDGKDGDYDGPHLKHGGHYNKLAHDIDLFINCTFEQPGGDYVAVGNNPIWKILGETWEGYHPLCRWGGNFKSKDSNHISIEHEGIA